MESTEHDYQARQRGNLGMELLLLVYLEQGRITDALYVLEQLPHLEPQELSQRLSPSYQDGLKPIHWIRLIDGQKGRETAVQALIYALYQDDNNDDLYQLLCDWQGQKAMVVLQALEQFVPYQERPVIWQAHLALAADNPTLATTLCQRAI